MRAPARVGLVALAPLLLLAEATAATRRSYATDLPPAAGGAGGRHLIVLGDSTAAGIGVQQAADTIGGQLGSRLGARWTSYGASGARAADLAAQIELVVDADAVLVLIGANDATHLTSLTNLGRDVRAAVAGLTAPVVVGTCPDLGAARAFAHPLRELADKRGRAVARTTARAVRAAGGTAVDLRALTGPTFRADPRCLSFDLFHPSARGYAVWAVALLPAVRQALAAGERFPTRTPFQRSPHA